MVKKKRSMPHIKTCVMWRDKSIKMGKSKGTHGGHVSYHRERKSKSLDKGCWVDKVRERKTKKEEKRKERKREKKEKKENKGGEPCVRGQEGERSEKLYLLFKIYGDRAIGFRWSKRQSSSTRRELRVRTRIWGFRQTPRGRGFSPTLVVLDLRDI